MRVGLTGFKCRCGDLFCAQHRLVLYTKSWWPMITDIMYVMLPMPLSFFGPGDSLVIISTEGGRWVDVAKFLTGASIIGSIAISSILKHANVIGLGAMFLVFACFLCLVVQHFVIFVWELKTKIAISKDCRICYVSEV